MKTRSEQMRARWAKIKAGKLPKPTRKSADDPAARPAVALLTKPLTRETPNIYQQRAVMFTAVPLPSQRQTVFVFRLKGKQVQYARNLSEIYHDAAASYARKEKAAKSQARRDGIPWRKARKQFIRDNTIKVPHSGSAKPLGKDNQ